MAAEGESALQSQDLHGPPLRTDVLTWDRGLQEIMAHSLSEWICHTSPTLLLSTNLYYYEKPCWCYTWDVQLCLQLLNRTQIWCFIDAENIFTMDRFLLFYTTSAQLSSGDMLLSRHSIICLIYILPHQCTYSLDASCSRYTRSVHPYLAYVSSEKKAPPYLLLLACSDQALLDLLALTWPCLPSSE